MNAVKKFIKRFKDGIVKLYSANKPRFICVACAIVVALIVLITLLIVFCGNNDKSNAPAPISANKTISPENHIVEWDDGLKIDVGTFAVDEEKEIIVTKKNAEINDAEGSKLQAYDISIDGVSQLNDYIEIRIPYDAAFIDENADEALCVCGLYFNEEMNDWENVLYNVDTEKNEVIIYTDHLSEYCYYVVRNEGKRNARFSGNVYAMMGGVVSREGLEPALAAMKSYIDNGGSDKGVFLTYAAKLLDFSDSVTSHVSSNTGVVSNLINVLKSGDVIFDSDLANIVNQKIGDFGEYASYAAIASLVMKSITDDNKNDVLQLYKESVGLLIGKGVESLGSSALTLSMSSVWVLDTAISALTEEAMQLKHDKLTEIYSYYYTHQSECQQNYRRACDWRRILIKIITDNKTDNEKAASEMKKEIDAYCEIFWNLPADAQWDVAAQLGYKEMPNIDADSRKTITEEFKADLYKSLEPVVYNIRQKLLNDVSRECITKIREVEKLFNRQMTVKVKEQIPDGKSSKYAGYRIRFEDLNEIAPERNWTGTLSNDGTITCKFSFIGYVSAGSMSKINLYKNDDDLKNGVIAKTLPLKLTGTETEIIIEAEDERPDFSGTYVGSYTDSNGDGIDFQLVVRLTETPSGASNGEDYYITATNLTTGNTMAGLDGSYKTVILFKTGKANVADPYRFTFNLKNNSVTYEYYNLFKKSVTESGAAYRI